MFNFFINAAHAMAPPNQGAGQGQQGSPIHLIVYFAIIIGVFYFILIRPQKKEREKRKKMLEELKKGDKIVTAGGILGEIIRVDEDSFLVKIANNVNVNMLKSSVSKKVEASVNKNTNKKGK